MRNLIKAFLMTMLAYLFQVCAMPYLKIAGVMPNLLAVNIAVLTVSLGKKYAFGASCLTGILLEAMTASVGALYVIIYPAVGMLMAQIFADMSDEKRGLRNYNNRKAQDVNPHVRILLNAMCISAGVEAIFLIYVTLSGAPLTTGHIARLLTATVYTTALAGVLMFPLRAFLRMYSGRIRRAMTQEDAADALGGRVP